MSERDSDHLDTHNLDGTQPITPQRIPAPPPVPSPPAPLPPRERREPRADAGEKRKRKNDERPAAYRPRDRRDNGLYLPAWSVFAMLLVVMVLVAGVVAVLLGLGGRAAPGGEPRVVIVTAFPSPTVPGVAAQFTPIGQAPQSGGVPQFPLEGPTLAPVIFTPTPVAIQIDVRVRVNTNGLNVRADAGLDQAVRFNANEGEEYLVVEGPRNANNLNWWRIQDVTDVNRVGWAAADYLEVIP